MNDWKDQSRRGEDPWDLPSGTEVGSVFASEDSVPPAPGPQSPGSYGAGAMGAALGSILGALPTLVTGDRKSVV